MVLYLKEQKINNNQVQISEAQLYDEIHIKKPLTGVFFVAGKQW